MTEEGKKYLSDITLAIDRIEDFLKEVDDFHSYEKDLKTQSAVERQLAIIGEALGQIKKTDPWLKVDNDKKIIAFRNRLVHGYDKIDNAIVWAILKKHLPRVKRGNRKEKVKGSREHSINAIETGVYSEPFWCI